MRDVLLLGGGLLRDAEGFRTAARHIRTGRPFNLIGVYAPAEEFLETNLSEFVTPDFYERHANYKIVKARFTKLIEDLRLSVDTFAVEFERLAWFRDEGLNVAHAAAAAGQYYDLWLASILACLIEASSLDACDYFELTRTGEVCTEVTARNFRKVPTDAMYVMPATYGMSYTWSNVQVDDRWILSDIYRMYRPLPGSPSQVESRFRAACTIPRLELFWKHLS